MDNMSWGSPYLVPAKSVNSTATVYGVTIILTLLPLLLEAYGFNDVRIMWIVVYAPHNLSNFNEVREAGERFGSIFNERQAKIFNEFITNDSLIVIPLGGFSFTWTDRWGSKMSKLDRLLVSESFCKIFSHVTGVVTEKGVLVCAGEVRMGERFYTPDLSVSIVVEKEEEKGENGLGGKTVNSAQ
nr:RNA-directed DNA polymerase, eukaryota [Tanacetum cinerariifolium]